MLRMMSVIFRLYDGCRGLLAMSFPLSQVKATGIFETLIRMKYDVPNDDLRKFDQYEQAVDDAIHAVAAANEERRPTA